MEVSAAEVPPETFERPAPLRPLLLDLVPEGRTPAPSGGGRGENQ